jgi:hypothetical protein
MDSFLREEEPWEEYADSIAVIKHCLAAASKNTELIRVLVSVTIRISSASQRRSLRRTQRRLVALSYHHQRLWLIRFQCLLL